MSEFSGVSIMLGAVTETESLRKTVETVIALCDKSDLAEIAIGYSPRATEGCLAVLDELQSTDLGVPTNNFVQKRPFMAGISDIIDSAKGSHCLLLASDMALDLDCVPKMIEMAKKQPNVIHKCSRWMPGCKFYDYGKLKQAANFLAQRYLRLLYGVKLTDFTIPVQIVPTEVYQSIEFEEIGFPMLFEMVLKPLRLGCEFTEIPTNCYPRTDGKSSNSVKQISQYLRLSLHVRFMKKEDILKKDCKNNGANK